MRNKVLVPVIVSLMSSILMCARGARDDRVVQVMATPTTAEIRRLIQAKGAKETLADLTADTGRWDGVLDRMANGEQEWLEIMIELYKGSDGGAALDLGIVAAEALAAEPERVLEVLEPVFGFEILCLNESSVGVDFQAAVQKIKTRRLAVSGVRDLKLSKQRARCLTMLESLEQEIRSAKARGDME